MIMTKNKSYLAGVLVFVCASILTSLTGFSHHGVTGQFDLDQNVTVTGTVNRVRFVNPHGYVYFKVTTESRKEEQWRCELRSGSLLKARGLDRGNVCSRDENHSQRIARPEGS